MRYAGWLVALLAAAAAAYFWWQSAGLQERLAAVDGTFDELDRGFSRALNAQDQLTADFAALSTPAEQSEQRKAFEGKLARLKEDLEPRAKIVRDHLMTLEPAEYALKSELISDEANAAFLAKVDADPAYTRTPSGLRYKVLNAADGGPRPTPQSEVSVHYQGTFIEGTEFDSSYKRNEPVTFPLGSLIPGWVEGIPLMREGETYEFVLPYRLAYGVAGRSAIPPRQTLVFKVELLKVASNPAP